MSTKFTLGAILAVGALLGMLIFTWLTLIGLEKIEVKNFEHHEAALLGALFSALGVLIIWLEH